MKVFFAMLTIILVIVGIFYSHALCLLAIVTGILAIRAAPSGLRSDEKEKSGGVVGPLIDKAEISSTMRDCPFCGNKIFREAIKCEYCNNYLN